MLKICEFCGKDYNAPSHRYKFCSPECTRSKHSLWVKENQSGKNNPFYGKKHSEETKKKQSKSKKDLIENGWKPSSYIDGRSKFISSNHLSKDTAWRAIRREILSRDNYICQLCKGDKATHVHHIIPRRIVKVHNKNNLISLCKECHELTYQKEEQFMHIFLGILRDANG